MAPKKMNKKVSTIADCFDSIDSVDYISLVDDNVDEFSMARSKKEREKEKDVVDVMPCSTVETQTKVTKSRHSKSKLQSSKSDAVIPTLCEILVHIESGDNVMAAKLLNVCILNEKTKKSEIAKKSARKTSLYSQFIKFKMGELKESSPDVKTIELKRASVTAYEQLTDDEKASFASIHNIIM